MTRRRRRWLVGGAVVLVGVVTLVWLDPSRRLLGRLAGEPFYDGRPASAWRDELTGKDEVKASAALQALAAGKGEAVPVCERLLADPDPAVRWRAAEALGGIGPAAAPAGPGLIAALNDPDRLVRGAAVRAVGKVTPDPAAAVPALVGQFPDHEAIYSVGQYGPNGSAAAPRLVELLGHPEGIVRMYAVQALRKTGGVGVPVLLDWLRAEPTAAVRVELAASLGTLGPAAAEAVPDLTKGLADPAHPVRQRSAWALGRIGPAAKPALEPLRKLAADPNKMVQEAAAEAVRRIEGK